MLRYQDFFKDEVEKLIIKQFQEKFSSECKAMNSTQNAWLEQNLTLKIGRDAVVNGCSFSSNQSIDLRTRQFCLDITKLLASMQQPEKNSLINDIVEKVRVNLNNTLPTKTQFVNALCDKLKKELNIVTYVGNINEAKKTKIELKASYDAMYDMIKNKITNEDERQNILSLSGNNLKGFLERKGFVNNEIDSIVILMDKINNQKNALNEQGNILSNVELDVRMYNKLIQSCNQNIFVIQDNTITINGNINCVNSRVNTIQDINVYLQSECFVKPVLQKLKNDAFLQRLYNQGDNADCKFYLEYGLCSNNQRTIKAKIISGNCGNLQTEEIIPCNKPICSISNWSDWSVCNFTNGKATRFRTRKFIKQGEECNNVMREVEECIIPDRYAGNDLIKQNALKYDLYDTYRGVLDKNTYILLFILLTILVLFVTIL